MPTSIADEVLDQIESHWEGQLRPRLEGLTDDEYVWTPIPSDPMTTIEWRLRHLVKGLAATNATYLGGPSTADLRRPRSAMDALALLDEVYAGWVAGIRALGDEGLAEPQGHRSPPQFAHAPVARVMLYTSVEVIHHGAEICLLRDLYVTR